MSLVLISFIRSRWLQPTKASTDAGACTRALSKARIAAATMPMVEAQLPMAIHVSAAFSGYSSILGLFVAGEPAAERLAMVDQNVFSECRVGYGCAVVLWETGYF